MHGSNDVNHLRCFSGSYLLVCFFVFLLNRLFVELCRQAIRVDGALLGEAEETHFWEISWHVLRKKRVTPDAAQKTGT